MITKSRDTRVMPTVSLVPTQGSRNLSFVSLTPSPPLQPWGGGRASGFLAIGSGQPKGVDFFGGRAPPLCSCPVAAGLGSKVGGCKVSGRARSLQASWADRREDQNTNPAPVWLADFRPSGADGGPPESRERVRFTKIVQVTFKISPGPVLRPIRGYFVFWGLAATG